MQSKTRHGKQETVAQVFLSLGWMCY